MADIFEDRTGEQFEIIEELDQGIRIQFNDQEHDEKCPVCGSTELISVTHVEENPGMCTPPLSYRSYKGEVEIRQSFPYPQTSWFCKNCENDLISTESWNQEDLRTQIESFPEDSSERTKLQNILENRK